MFEEVKDLSEHCKLYMQKVTSSFHQYLQQMLPVRINPSLLEHIKVNVGGYNLLIKNMSSIDVISGHVMQVTPWDASMIHKVVKAIQDSDTVLEYRQEANSILLSLPLMSKEYKLEVARNSKKHKEDYRINLRNIRLDIRSKINATYNSKSEHKSALHNKLLQELDKQVNFYSKELDKIFEKAFG